MSFLSTGCSESEKNNGYEFHSIWEEKYHLECGSSLLDWRIAVTMLLTIRRDGNRNKKYSILYLS